ncbi:MAG: D-alanyl-D-alanine carboxypeptidase family protein [Clostridium sp.]|nr:D-alanyl-D-alanine carboxypeptidase family protein [Clostridium sp.]
MNCLKKICITLFLFLIIFVSGCTSTYASTIPDTYSSACLLMEESTGKILYSKNANSIMYPASTTKIMTAILTLEKCNLSDTAVVSHNAVFSIPSGYSTASLVEGEVLTIEQLLNVLLIPSANDAAVVLAEHIAGSVEAFSDMMNAKAVELGCLNTHFVNPNGIHNENHYSTAYDLALIGKYAMQFPTFKEISSKTRYTLPITNAYSKEDRIFNTTNDLIKPNYSSSPTNYYYKYATGGKTGYTDPAGQCIVATATKDNISLIAVTLHGDFTEDNLSQRALDCKALFEYGFNNFSMVSIAQKGDVASNMKVPNATKDSSSLDLLYSDDIYAFVPNGFDTSSVTPNIKLSSTFAPIAQDTVLGTISYDIDGSNYSCNLLASHEVYKNQFAKTAMELSLLLIFLILLSKVLKRKKRRKNYRKKPKK